MMTLAKSDTRGRFLLTGLHYATLFLFTTSVLVLLSSCSQKETSQTQTPEADTAPAPPTTAMDTNFVDGVRPVAPEYADVPGVRAWDQPKFQGWEWTTHENVKMLYPPYHPLKDQIPGNARAYKSTMDKVVKLLGMEPFTDTLVVIYYTGYGQGRAMTGHEYPYADSDAVHIWLPSFPGPPMMQWLLPKWSKVEPKHEFLKHGLIAMFDFSGQNYHQATHMFVDSGEFIALRYLVEDTSINSNKERYQTGEAASFAAFLLSTRGLSGLRRAYESDLTFDSLMRLEYQTSVDSVQAMWLTFAKDFVPDELTAKGGTQMKSDK